MATTLVATTLLAATPLAATPLAATPLAATLGPMARADPLIPRQVLFGNPSRNGAVVSPDGTRIAYLAPRDGVMNVWVAPVGDIAQARPVTSEKTRPLDDFFFSPDSTRILYLQDNGGRENFLLYGVRLSDGATTAYTPFTNTRVEIAGSSPLVHDAILIGLNNRDPQWHDLYRLDLNSGALTLLRKGDGIAGFTADFALTPRLAQKVNDDGSFSIETLLPAGGVARLFDIPFADGLTTSVIGIPRNGGSATVIDSRGHDTASLESVDLRTGAETMLARDPTADIGGVLADPRTGTPHAFEVEYLHRRWVPLDDRYRADIGFLDGRAPGQWSVTSQSDDDRLWTLMINGADAPASFWLYDRAHRTLTRLFTARPELEPYRLRPMQDLTFKARDGRTLTAYLTRPIKPGPAPLVLYVHGGPWARDSDGYNPTHQWLANRGYAVLSVNFRGSTGFGKAFLSAGNRQWGAAMEDDLLDAASWAVAHGVADAGRIAITGGSYGGYATLAGLTMHPDRFACGVDIVGPSNLLTLLQTIPPYWKSGYEQMVARIGDPRTAAGRALLKARSPLTYADRIVRPLLIAQGANDPRVNRRESDQIVAAMQARGIPVTYLLYPDEGHGFARSENQVSFYAVEEGFLAGCLHGRAQPIGKDLEGSSIEVLQGADMVPGLAGRKRLGSAHRSASRLDRQRPRPLENNSN